MRQAECTTAANVEAFQSLSIDQSDDQEQYHMDKKYLSPKKTRPL